MGRLIRCITTDGLVIGAAVDSTDIVRRAKEIHNTSSVVTAALGRLLTGASIMGNRLKEDKASLTLRVEGDGPIGSMIAASDSLGNVRGLAVHTDADAPSVGDAVGSGLLGVIKDYGEGQPYTAQVPLASGEIAEDLTSYYAVSEQTPTVFMLGVHQNEDGEVDAAGGLLIQLLPLADEREIVKIEKSLSKMTGVAAMLREGKSLEEICACALEDFELEFFDETDVAYECKCSAEKVEQTLESVGEEELRSMAAEGRDAEICCHFCDKRYYYSTDELLALAEKIKMKKSKNNC